MRAVSAAFAILLVAAATPAAADEARAWAALAEGGHVLVLRHAATDAGIGDPPGFRPDDCATQRNLSADGRRQAREWRDRIAARGVAIGPVLSSRWCRCLETATLAFGRAEPWPALDSFFGDAGTRVERTRELLDRVRAWRGPGTLVLVTHQVNVVAAVGEPLAMGEAIVLDRDARVVGRLAAPS